MAAKHVPDAVAVLPSLRCLDDLGGLHPDDRHEPGVVLGEGVRASLVEQRERPDQAALNEKRSAQDRVDGLVPVELAEDLVAVGVVESERLLATDHPPEERLVRPEVLPLPFARRRSHERERAVGFLTSQEGYDTLLGVDGAHCAPDKRADDLFRPLGLADIDGELVEEGELAERPA